MKRLSDSTKEVPKTKQKRNLHWSMGLVEKINQPEYVIRETNNLVVINDKYPKAKVHYLMIPKQNIMGIHHLERKHLKLLEEFSYESQKLKDRHTDCEFKVGFHAIPSMQRLHMHIISTDMISPFLKTKVHWNSYNTEFFISLNVLFKELDENGCVSKLTQEEQKILLARPLSCHKCSFVPKNMPLLKEHLLIHK